MKRHRNFYKILSIAIAVFLWLYVFIEVSPMTTSTFRDVKVQMENENILESRGLAILSVQPENIDVNVEGKRGNFFQLKHTDILATLDCAELHEGINVVPVRVVLPDSYKIEIEEHTSELQSPGHLVCRLLLEKKKAHI